MKCHVYSAWELVIHLNLSSFNTRSSVDDHPQYCDTDRDVDDFEIRSTISLSSVADDMGRHKSFLICTPRARSLRASGRKGHVPSRQGHNRGHELSIAISLPAVAEFPSLVGESFNVHEVGRATFMLLLWYSEFYI